MLGSTHILEIGFSPSSIHSFFHSRGTKPTTVFLYFCIHPTKVLHKNQNIMTNVGCILYTHSRNCPLALSTRADICHSCHSRPECNFFAEFKKKERKKLSNSRNGATPFFDIIIATKVLHYCGNYCIAFGSVCIASLSASFYTQCVIIHFLSVKSTWLKLRESKNMTNIRSNLHIHSWWTTIWWISMNCIQIEQL